MGNGQVHLLRLQSICCEYVFAGAEAHWSSASVRSKFPSEVRAGWLPLSLPIIRVLQVACVQEAQVRDD